jgi:hypothetical protein
MTMSFPKGIVPLDVSDEIARLMVPRHIDFLRETARHLRALVNAYHEVEPYRVSAMVDIERHIGRAIDPQTWRLMIEEHVLSEVDGKLNSPLIWAYIGSKINYYARELRAMGIIDA